MTLSRRIALLFVFVLGLALSASEPSFAAPKAAPNKVIRKPKAKPTVKRPALGVREMFVQAQQLYDAGKYPAALVAYDTILRQYPGHEPSTIQLAKTLYRLDRVQESFSVFTRVNPQGLDDETSYEYGWSFYTNQQWDGALFGFQKVSKGHALYDLANYYGAICAIKLRRYDLAEDMLERAVVLPDKLAKSRTLLVKHVQALKLIQEKNLLTKERRDEKERLKREAEAKNPSKAGAGAAAGQAPAASGYTHHGLKSITKEAAVKYSQIQQTKDYHGTKEENYKSQVTSFSLQSGPLFPLPLKIGKERQAAIGLQLLISAEDRLSEGTMQRLIIDESNQDITRVLTSDPEVEHTKAGVIGAAPFIEVPLPQGIWLAAGADFNFTYPEFERADRTGYRKGYLGLGGIVDKFEYNTEAGYTEILDKHTKPTSTKTNGDLKGKYSFESNLALIARVGYAQLDYLEDLADLNGPDSSTSFELRLEQGLPFGFLLKGGGIFEYQANNVVHNIPSFGEIAADGQVITGKVALLADPFPWLSASIEQLFVKSTWKQDNEAARDAFEANVIDYLEQFTATVGINMAF